MREKQDSVVNRFENELRTLATEGEIAQYIITGICTGLVLCSLAAIMPVFNWVIKDKSYVLAIFSDIERTEIQKVIEECHKMDLRTVKYKSEWVERYENNQNAFWNKLMSEHKKGFGKKWKKIKNNVDVAIKKLKAEVPSEAKNEDPNAASNSHNKDQKENDGSEENNSKEAKIHDQSVVEESSLHPPMTNSKRRELLSETEYALFCVFFRMKT